MVAAFETFVARIPGVCAVCADDDVAADIAATVVARADAVGSVVTYGFAESADYRMHDYEGNRGGTQFTLVASRARCSGWCSSRCPDATTR